MKPWHDEDGLPNGEIPWPEVQVRVVKQWDTTVAVIALPDGDVLATVHGNAFWFHDPETVANEIVANGLVATGGGWMDRPPTPEEVEAHARAWPYAEVGLQIRLALWIVWPDPPAGLPKIVCFDEQNRDALLRDYGMSSWRPAKRDGTPVAVSA